MAAPIPAPSEAQARAAVAPRWFRSAVVGVLALIGAAGLWGSNYVVARAVNGAVPLIPMVFLRWFLALPLLLPWLLPTLRREWPVISAHRAYLTRVGVLGVALFSLFIYAAAYETLAIQVALIYATTPIWVILLARLRGAEGVSSVQLAGIAAALAGTAIIVTKGEPGYLLHMRLNRGDLWALIAAILFAWYSLELRRRPAGMSQLTLLAVTGAIGVAALTPLYLWHLARGGAWLVGAATGANSLLGAYGAVLYIVLGPTLLGNVLWIFGVARLGASRASPFLYVSPVMAATLAIVFLGEHLMPFHIVGTVGIATGLALATWTDGQVQSDDLHGTTRRNAP
jgi:drug/metabolite transporter (DMT)-like permease